MTEERTEHERMHILRCTVQMVYSTDSENYQVEESTDEHLSLYNPSSQVLLEFRLNPEIGYDATASLMLHISGANSPEVLGGDLEIFMRRRDVLRRRGYQRYERFREYDDGFECVYEVPQINTSTGLRNLLRNFDLGDA